MLTDVMVIDIYIILIALLTMFIVIIYDSMIFVCALANQMSTI